MNHENIEQETTRDYDKNPIKIIDYGVLFELSIIMIIFLVATPFIIDDFNEIVLSDTYFNFNAFKVYIFVLLEIWFFYGFFVAYPKEFSKYKSYFLFMNRTIEYHYSPNVNYNNESFLSKYIFNYKNNRSIILKVNISNIKDVNKCFVSGLSDRYGRWHYLNAWQLYRKSSIGVHIGKSTLFLRYLIQYILFEFPYRLWRLFRYKEKFNLLDKNMIMHFNNRNYFLINIYKKNELEQLMKYFKAKNIKVSNKTYFIPHLQNQGWFVSKEETWTNNFNLGENNGK